MHRQAELGVSTLPSGHSAWHNGWSQDSDRPFHSARMTLPIRNARIRLPQGQLFWKEVGTGPTIIFLHGAWSDSGEWTPLLDRLGDRFHCIAPDLLGFGESERLGNYSIALETECLADYLDTLRISQVYLVGHSIGAWVAANYALQYAHQVSGLVLIDPEGVELDNHRYPWRRARGWVGSFPIWTLLLWLLRPLAWLLGKQAQWRSHHRTYQKLKRSPAACRLLFQRRWAELQAELLTERLPWLKQPLLVVQSPTASAAQQEMAQRYATAPQAYLQPTPAEISALADAICAMIAGETGERPDQPRDDLG